MPSSISVMPHRFRWRVPASGNPSAASPSCRVDSAAASRPPATPPLHLRHRARTTSEVLREPELAPRDDVLLDLGAAAADGVDDGVAVGRLGPALHRCLL